MNILFVSAILPWPLVSGGQVRIYNLLKRLSKKHDITLVSFIREGKEREYKKNLSFCKKVLMVWRGKGWQGRYIFSSLFYRYPFLYATYNNHHMRSLLEEELKNNYDLIHAEPGYVWLSLPETNVPIVVSEHNVEHEVYEKYIERTPIRFFLSHDVKKMKHWESVVWHKADHLTAVTEDDRNKMTNIVDKNKITTVANGVDLQQFSFRHKKTISSSPVFLYVGTFAWIQNRDAVEYLLKKIWPLIQKKYPKAKLRIVGKNPSKKLLSLARTGVLFVNFADDIHTEYISADILLAPIRVGGGTKYKIIESMASGLPVITTTTGAQGISSKEKVLWIADDPNDVLREVDDIIYGTARSQILLRARKLVEDNYSWESIAKTLDEVWRKVHEENT